jgi:hypothetical protein
VILETSGKRWHMADNVLMVWESGHALPGDADLVDGAQAVALLKTHGAGAAAMMLRTDRQRTKFLEHLAAQRRSMLLMPVSLEQVTPVAELLERMGSHPSHPPVVLVGEGATLATHRFGTIPAVRAIALGAWLDTIVDLARFGIDKADRVPGLLVRVGNGFQLTERLALRPQMAAWPAPDWSGLPIDEILDCRGRVLPLRASHGFPYESPFSAQPLVRHLHECQSYYHPLPAATVVTMAAQGKVARRARAINFVDEIFPWDEPWLDVFLEGWARQVALPFHIRSSADHLDEARLRRMAQAGLQRVTLDVAAGSPAVRALNSNLNGDDKELAALLAECAELGVETHVRLMLGCPGETPESLAAAVEFARRCTATRLTTHVYTPPPDNPHWRTLEKQLTGSSTAPRRPADARIQGIVATTAAEIDVLRLAKEGTAMATASWVTTRRPGVLDATAAIAEARLESPYRVPLRLARFHSPAASADVLALRVPTEISWTLDLPDDAIISFGMLLEPRLPGERVRHPIVYSVRAEQGARHFRLFQKVLLQALDPDSRRWHWFRIPVAGVEPGRARLVFAAEVLGGDSTQPLEEAPIWAGWARLQVTTRREAQLAESALVEAGAKAPPAERLTRRQPTSGHHAGGNLVAPRIMPARSDPAPARRPGKSDSTVPPFTPDSAFGQPSPTNLPGDDTGEPPSSSGKTKLS